MPVHANRLRKIRRAAGLTQGEVAQVLRLTSPTSVSRWERGERLPDPTRLLELAALYRRSVNDLLLPRFLSARDRVNARLRALNLTPRL